MQTDDLLLETGCLSFFSPGAMYLGHMLAADKKSIEEISRESKIIGFKFSFVCLVYSKMSLHGKIYKSS